MTFPHLPRRRSALAIALALGCWIALTPGASADVVEAAPDAFTVQSAFDVDASPTQVYQAFVGSVGSWWHPDHTFSGDSRQMSIDASPGGCFCEKLESGGVRHMTVVYADSPRLIRLAGGLGPLQTEAVTGVMSWSFEGNGEGTRIIVTYKVAGSSATNLEEWAPAVDGVLAQAADRLARFVATGSPD